VNRSTCRGAGTISPTFNPAATSVSVASLPRLFQIAVRPAELRWMTDRAGAAEDQSSAADNKRVATADGTPAVTAICSAFVAPPIGFRLSIRMNSRIRRKSESVHLNAQILTGAAPAVVAASERNIESLIDFPG
jgi:hypothetical protein